MKRQDQNCTLPKSAGQEVHKCGFFARAECIKRKGERKEVSVQSQSMQEQTGSKVEVYQTYMCTISKRNKTREDA